MQAVFSVGRVLHALALFVVFGFLVVKAFAEFQAKGDFMWYHLPWALRLFDLTTFTPNHHAMIRYEGFPFLAEFLQGLGIWLTGRMSVACAINAFGFALLVGAIRLVFGAEFSLRWFLTFLLAVPLFVIHFAIGYIDLFVGCMLAIGFVGVMGLQLGRRPALSATVATLGLAASTWSKFQAWPPGFLLACFFVFFLVRAARQRTLRLSVFTAVIVALIVGMGVFPLRNAVRFGNPTYPYQFPIASLHLPSAEPTYFSSDPNTPYNLRRTPYPFVFFISVYELTRLEHNATFHWNFGQNFYSYYTSSHPSYVIVHHRMGGWFVLTALLTTVLLAYGMVLRVIPRTMGFLHLSMIALIACIPHYHELRYCFFVPLDSFILLAYAFSRFPAVVRRWAEAGFLLCAAYVMLHVPNVWSIDWRTPEQKAPAEARRFWLRHAGDSVGWVPLRIRKPNNEALYWAGPTFDQFAVINTAR